MWVPQDIYKYVTHEKGILGSQGDYNQRHRRLCAPPFRNKHQLEAFAEIVVQRWVRRGGGFRGRGGGDGGEDEMVGQAEMFGLGV
jgi:hypothetical protein